MGDFYSHNNEEVELPHSVQQMINQICKKERQNSPDDKVRRLLVAIGEERSLCILREISKCQIKKTLSGFIVFMAKKYYQSETQQFYQKQNYEEPVPSAESFYHSPQIRRSSLSSPNSSCSSVNFSPRNRPIFQDNDIVGDASDSPTSAPRIPSPPMSPVTTSFQRDHYDPRPSTFRDRASTRGISEQLLALNIVGDASDSPTSAPRIPSPPMSPVTTSFQRDHYDPRPSTFRDRASTRGISEQLLALSKLEFRKFFLILNYIGRRKVEDVIMLHDVGDILDMIYQPMSHFESYIWNKYGHLCEHNKRVQYLDWDSGRTHLYHCHVHSDGSYTFKGPYLKAERTHLQQSLGDENVLIVKFEQNTPGCPEEIVQNGILVGLRRYRFFVYKDDGKKRSSKDKEEKIDSVKCYFVRMESLNPYEKETYILRDKMVHEARCNFMHVHMVSSMAKYMARFSLTLSTTVKLQVDLNSVNIDRIEDICCHVYYLSNI
uniref:RNA-dependent RNA polymerase n=1 Tax=Solanum tuberosum TaxID=4113 RepID=M0ZHN6_SOLTU